MRCLTALIVALSLLAGCGETTDSSGPDSSPDDTGAETDAGLEADGGAESDAVDDRLCRPPEGCTRAQAEKRAEDWNTAKRNPTDGQTFLCDGDAPVHQVRRPDPGYEVQECTWVAARWDDGEWHDESGPGIWRPVCTCE